MEQSYTKKDFFIGQEVYAEYVGLTGLRNKKGDISLEVVTSTLQQINVCIKLQMVS